MKPPLTGVAPYLLACALAGTAALKVAVLGDARSTAYDVATVGEFALAVLLLIPASRSLAASVVAGGFLGAALPTARAALRDGLSASCSCLGSVPTTHAWALVLQGLLVAFAGLVLSDAIGRDDARRTV